MSLTIAVLSYSDEFYTTQRLLHVGKELGHRVSILNPFGLTVQTDRDGITIREDARDIDPPDVIIPRVGAVLIEWNLFIVDALIRAGARSPATSDALALASDKARTSVALADAKIPAIPTYVLREEASIAFTLAQIQDQNIVLKLPHGTQGRNVVGATCHVQAHSQIVSWLSQGHSVIVQPWVPMDRPRDLRVMVVGKKAIAAIWRYAKVGEFRANIHQGGHAQPADLSPDLCKLAEAATEAIGLNCGAVDIIETAEGMAVLEINGCPGLRSMEETTGLDLASLWIQAAIDD